MKKYDPIKIEEKWQKIWEEEETFKAKTSKEAKKDGENVQKMYIAEMFPYPSGAGLHVGHVRNFSIADAVARFYTQQGLNVLRPFGYDTFGLPAENYAIKTGISPEVATKQNIDNFRKQAKRVGFAIDWSREVNTSDPKYYKWTQWCFLKLFEKGLAYQKESYQWWCPVDQTVLANEQVENGHCWRLKLPRKTGLAVLKAQKFPSRVIMTTISLLRSLLLAQIRFLAQPSSYLLQNIR